MTKLDSCWQISVVAECKDGLMRLINFTEEFDDAKDQAEDIIEADTFSFFDINTKTYYFLKTYQLVRVEVKEVPKGEQ